VNETARDTYRPFSTSNPAVAGCSSGKARHSITPRGRIRGRGGRRV